MPTYSDYGAARHPHDNSNNSACATKRAVGLRCGAAWPRSSSPRASCFYTAYRAIRVDNATDNFLYAEFTDFLLDWNMTEYDAAAMLLTGRAFASAD